MAAIKRNLRVVWGNNPPARYLPKAVPDRPVGSFAWGVWDDKEKRFLKDREVRAMSAEQLSQTLSN
jgi:hypothetical protein